MIFRSFCGSLSRSPLNLSSISSILAKPPLISRSYPLHPEVLKFPPSGIPSVKSLCSVPVYNTNSVTSEPRMANGVSIPHPDGAGRSEIFRAVEAALGTGFSSQPIVPNPSPLIIVVSGPSGVGKDAVIRRLMEVREDLHFVVTATSRAKRPGEIDGKDYFFLSKDEFLTMIEKNELLEYALVYGDYKGIPKQQIRDHMAAGRDIVVRVDIQGAATLRRVLRNSAVFVFLVAESEEALVKRLIDRKTETVEALLMRVAAAREELRHLKEFDYVIVNKEGEMESSVRLLESIIDTEKAKVVQRTPIL